MNSYEIKVSCNNDEAEQFVDWLVEQGHSAELSDDTGNYVDEVWTSTDGHANEIMRTLWSAYCTS